jgi:hypothetical protein
MASRSWDFVMGALVVGYAATISWKWGGNMAELWRLNHNYRGGAVIGDCPICVVRPHHVGCVMTRPMH